MQSEAFHGSQLLKQKIPYGLRPSIGDKEDDIQLSRNPPTRFMAPHKPKGTLPVFTVHPHHRKGSRYVQAWSLPRLSLFSCCYVDYLLSPMFT